MKPNPVFLVALILFLTACQSAQPPSPVLGAPFGDNKGSGVRETTPPPTATPIPTPTLHPVFAALQDQIAATGERFTLQTDGRLWDGETKNAIDGLRASPSGEMTLTLADGTVVTLDPTQAIYDDENGFSYPGYVQDEAGEWVEAVVVLTPEQQLSADLERWGLSEDKYNIGYDKDGKIELRAKGSNQLVYWDGRWSSNVIIKMVVAENDCLGSEFVLVGANKTKPELKEGFVKYSDNIWRLGKQLIGKSEDPNQFPFSTNVYLKDTNNCWGVFINAEMFSPNYLVWQRANEEVAVVKVFEPRALNLK